MTLPVNHWLYLMGPIGITGNNIVREEAVHANHYKKQTGITLITKSQKAK